MRLSRKPVLIGLGVVAVSVVGTALLFYWRHHESKPASTESADAEFQQIRARFADQQPLLDMGERRAREREVSSGTVGSLRAFHTVIFDTRGGPRLVRITVPYWFARRFARHGGEFRWLGELTFLDDTEFDPEAIQLSWEQIERQGPGLLVDYQHASGGKFMAWVE